MSWDCLSAEVACMFAEYTWRADEVQSVLEIRAAQLRESERERQRSPWYRANQRRYQRKVYRERPEIRERAVKKTDEWRKANPERARKLFNEAARRQRERAKADPEYAERFRAQRREAKRRYVEKHREKMREVWRRNSAAYRARKRPQS